MTGFSFRDHQAPVAETEAPPPIGSNFPPSPIDDFEAFEETLAHEVADLRARIRDVQVGVEKAPKIVVDENAGMVVTFIAQIKSLIQEAKDAHKRLKAPWLKRGQAVDDLLGPKGSLRAGLETGLHQLEKAHAVYHRQKAEAERKAKEEAERRAREEEERKRAEAARLEEEAKRQAQEAEDREARAAAAAKIDAAERAKAAAAKAAERLADAQKESKEKFHTRGDYGGTSYSVRRWVHEIQDFEVIPLAILRPYLDREAVDKAIRAAIKDGMRELRGVRIYETEDVRTKV